MSENLGCILTVVFFFLATIVPVILKHKFHVDNIYCITVTIILFLIAVVIAGSAEQ